MTPLSVADNTFQFLTCVSLTAHVIAIGWTSVLPSVRHTLVLCQNGSAYRQTVFTAWYPHDSSFLSTKLFPGIPMGTPPTGALNARGRKKLQFPTNISL